MKTSALTRHLVLLLPAVAALTLSSCTTGPMEFSSGGGRYDDRPSPDSGWVAYEGGSWDSGFSGHRSGAGAGWERGRDERGSRSAPSGHPGHADRDARDGAMPEALARLAAALREKLPGAAAGSALSLGQKAASAPLPVVPALDCVILTWLIRPSLAACGKLRVRIPG